MKDFSLSLIVFLFTSYILVIVDYFDFSPNVVQRTIIFFVTLLLILLNITYSRFVKTLNTSRKWILLFIINTLVQFIVITSGGLFSPILILIHLTTIGISLFFSFSVATAFLFLSFLNITINILFNPLVASMIQNDPAVLLLITASFIAIVPLSKLLSDTYHVRGTLLRTLSNQIKLEESLLAEVNELIFITDSETRILSINDAVERRLRRSRSELLHKPLFDVLFLKDNKGNIVTKDILGINELLQTKSAKVISELSLLATHETMKKVAIQVKPISNVQGIADQLSFIITDSRHMQNITAGEHKNIEEAQIKHEAMMQDLKRRLIDQGLFDFASRLIFIDKLEQDILSLRTIEDHGIIQNKVLIDVAGVCRQIINQEQDFAKALNVLLTFNLADFKEKDIRHSLLETFNISSQRPTGPFFTSLCDVKYFELLIQRLLNVAILLASNQPNLQTTLSIRQNTTSLIITITTSCPQFFAQLKDDVFLQYYGILRDKSNLHLGSGLEGFLAKTIADALNIPLTINVADSYCTFTLGLKKYVDSSLMARFFKR